MARTRIELERNEVVITLRALRELREKGDLSWEENTTVVNLVDYIEAESGVR